MTTRFKAIDRETPYLLPPLVHEWLPEQHLAWFVVEVVSKLDLHELKMPYKDQSLQRPICNACARAFLHSGEWALGVEGVSEVAVLNAN